MNGLAVRCVGVGHVYHLDGQDVLALEGIDLAIGAGATVAIVGPSGSGKSTLMNLLAGLQRPTSGHLYIGEQQIAALSQNALLRLRAEHLGVVVQNPSRNLLPFLDAAGNIRFAQRGPRSYGRRHLPEPDGLLRELGLDQLAGARVDRLSGGERQRLALAVGMAARPGVLLADEPTSQLDTANRDGVVELVNRISERYGTTVVAVTHDHDVAAGLSRTIALHEGRLCPDAAA